MAIDVEVPPVRVEWRPNLSSRWALVSAAGPDEAARIADESIQRWGGYCRMIEQKVVASSPRHATVPEPRIPPGPARLERSLEVLWRFDAPGGYEWRARLAGQTGAGTADTEDDAWHAGLAWWLEGGS